MTGFLWFEKRFQGFVRRCNSWTVFQFCKRRLFFTVWPSFYRWQCLFLGGWSGSRNSGTNWNSIYGSMYWLRAQTTLVLRATRVVLHTCGTTHQLPEDPSDVLCSCYQLPEPNAGSSVWRSDYWMGLVFQILRILVNDETRVRKYHRSGLFANPPTDCACQFD